MTVNPKEFWENKILGWESGRYDNRPKASSFLEKIANRSSNSLRFRMDVAGQLLKRHVTAKHVVEVGCGSALLAEKIIAMGAASYTGYDFAESAISQAQKRVTESGFSERIRLMVKSVDQLANLQADIVFSLGLLDWLNDEELKNLFRSSGAADYLHAIAEKRLGLSQFFHRIYIHLAYGYRTIYYIPRYYDVSQLKDLINQFKTNELHVYRNHKLSFAALISSLPISGQSKNHDG